MSHPPDARYGRGPTEESLERAAGEANAEQMHRHGAVRLRRISAISAISRASRQGPPWSTSVSRGASHCILSLPCVRSRSSSSHGLCPVSFASGFANRVACCPPKWRPIRPCRWENTGSTSSSTGIWFACFLVRAPTSQGLGCLGGRDCALGLMSRPGDMIKSLPRPLWLLDREVFDVVFCTDCLGFGLPKEKSAPLFVLAELRILLLLFLLFGGKRSYETGKKTLLVGSFLHLHPTSQLLPVTHMRKKLRAKKLHQEHLLPASIFSISPIKSTTIARTKLR